mmetsp:Transcript_11433/g.32947  ORF Transcript_11433/g.32947 Transcript_11433/m.32947 type:complete len:289 (+) Transcript_11433:242-1108(+)
MHQLLRVNGDVAGVKLGKVPPTMRAHVPQGDEGHGGVAVRLRHAIRVEAVRDIVVPRVLVLLAVAACVDTDPPLDVPNAALQVLEKRSGLGDIRELLRGAPEVDLHSAVGVYLLLCIAPHVDDGLVDRPCVRPVEDAAFWEARREPVTVGPTPPHATEAIAVRALRWLPDAIDAIDLHVRRLRQWRGKGVRQTPGVARSDAIRPVQVAIVRRPCGIIAQRQVAVLGGERGVDLLQRGGGALHAHRVGQRVDRCVGPTGRGRAPDGGAAHGQHRAQPAERPVDVPHLVE